MTRYKYFAVILLLPCVLLLSFRPTGVETSASSNDKVKFSSKKNASNDNPTSGPILTNLDDFVRVIHQKKAFKEGIRTTKLYQRNSIHLVQRNSSTPYFCCNAPKSGCTSWNFFYAYLERGQYWTRDIMNKNPGVVYLANGAYRAGMEKKYPDRVHLNVDVDNEQFAKLTQTADHVLIVRNPYVRFLSSYQDWISGRVKVKQDFSFEQFVQLYRNGSIREVKGTLMNHIEPISTVCHVGEVEYRVLRVEEQAIWFDAFIEKYQLSQQLRQYKASGNVLFDSELKANATLGNFVPQLSSKEAWPAKIFSSGHHRGSVNKLAKYYTPELANEVTKIVKNDLINFDYPFWDGYPESFRLI